MARAPLSSLNQAKGSMSAFPIRMGGGKSVVDNPLILEGVMKGGSSANGPRHTFADLVG